MAKKNKMTPEEEAVQRALGTLSKFEVCIERDATYKQFARVYVTAADEESAKERALEIAKEGKDDDTFQPVAWATNASAEGTEPAVDKVRPIPDDDYMAHRFTSREKPADEKTDITFLGKVM